MDAMTRLRCGPVQILEFTGLPADQKFDRLLEQVEPERLERMDPLKAAGGASHEVPELALRLRDRATSGPPRFLLAYCTAAPLALHLAAAWQNGGAEPPHTVLFDPDPGSSTYLRQEFTTLCGNLGVDPAAALSRSARAEGDTLLALLCEDLRGFRETLTESYGGDAEADELVGHLLGRYDHWLAFLAAGMAAGPARVTGAVSVVTGAGKPLPALDRMLADPSVATVHPCATQGSPLLVSDAAAATLRRILGGTR